MYDITWSEGLFSPPNDGSGYGECIWLLKRILSTVSRFFERRFQVFKWDNSHFHAFNKKKENANIEKVLNNKL